MHPIRVFITPLSAALVGTVLMTTPAFATPDADTDFPAEVAARIGDQVERAHRTVARAEARVLELGRPALPYAVSAGLKAAQRSVTEAERLAGTQVALAPGLARVRERLTAVVAEGRANDHTVALLDDATVTLRTLSVNSAVVEAVGHLEVAVEALAHANPAVADGALEHAEAALVLARARGGDHVAGDLDAVRDARRALAGTVHTPDLDAALRTRIAQVRCRVLDLRPAAV